MHNSTSDGDRIRRYFTSLDGDIRYIFSPFIQKQAFEKVIPSSSVETVVVTRWRQADLISGVSDPELFELCRDNGYTLKIHSRLHAKIYSWDLYDGLVGSSNLTKNGMGLSEVPNIEVLVGPTELPVETQLKLRKAEKDAQLVTREDYEKAVEAIETTETVEPNYNAIDVGQAPEFLVSHLPMTEDPDLLISVLAGDHSMRLADLSPEQQRCVLHDISTYSLDNFRGKPEIEVRDGLRECFVGHKFIEMIVDEMDPCVYFGEMKALVQERCADVPTPSRRELTGNIQVLYSWFPELYPDRFVHDIPGRRSERLCDLSKPDSK
jgi:hypothetical protein